ncbi:MAG TPA: aminodeoxychorismate synthase, component I, partial [Opitutae bacterium]|nr:aminodeoxychorismate synthase, component I [Opitutae bacterium]
MLVRETTYPIDHYGLLLEIEHLKHPFALESTLEVEDFGEYSFFGADPFLTLEAKNGQITRTEGTQQQTYSGDPFTALDKLLEQYASPPEDPVNIPFCGGAVGYIGYDLCHHIETLPKTTSDDIGMPDLFFGFYDGVIAVKHTSNQVFLIAHSMSKDPEATLNKLEGWCQ